MSINQVFISLKNLTVKTFRKKNICEELILRKNSFYKITTKRITADKFRT